MYDNDKSDHLEMRWIAVTGTDGRTRMEARWISMATAMQPAAHAA